MGAYEALTRRLRNVPSVRSETATFVSMTGAKANVIIGTNTVSLPLAGWYPPVVGMAVQVEWRAGRGIVTGPAKALNPVGTISGTGSPQATVTVDGTPYLLYIRTGYTPVVSDLVTINWATGVIEGKISGQATPAPPSGGGGSGGTSFTNLLVKAADSGRYQAGSGWWGDDPWASSSNDGIWTYLNRVRDAISGASITAVSIYLPLQQQLGNASIGTHAYPSIPGGAPSLASLQALALGNRSGWVALPTSFAAYLSAGGRGIGVRAPGGGFNKWTGTALDSLSGALRFSGTR